jgi:transposase
MIPLPTGVRVWIAAGHSDMRRGMQGLARQVQEGLQRDPHICGETDYVAAGAFEP